MGSIWFDEDEGNLLKERYDLALCRIREILQERSVPADFVSYFHSTARFILLCCEVKERLENGTYDADPEKMREDNYALYRDILPENYDESYANPAYACSVLGEEMGKLLCFLYAQERGLIAYIFEGKLEEAAAHAELFVQVYGIIAQAQADASGQNTDKGDLKKLENEVREALYWFESDYADVIAAHRIREGIDPACSFFTDILMNADLSGTDYLYRYGEYITDNEIRMARFLNSLPQEEIDRMADTWSEGYRMGFVLAGKPIEKKRTVNLHFFAGLERVVRKAVLNFRKIGLEPTVYRSSVSALTTSGASRTGFSGAAANPQYDYDHKEDAALMMDARYVERRVEVTHNTYEKLKELANAHGGPAVIELFGQKPFEPRQTMQAWSYDKAQRALSVKLRNRQNRITQEYIIGKERSFTIISFPTPEIDENRFEEIFMETVRVNTLDASLYTRIQSTIIEALNKGTRAHIVGTNGNRTDLTVQFQAMTDPDKETIFENCVADVNIPVGEVFTSPRLKGTNGVLHVSSVYLEGLNYRDLEIHFTDGMTGSTSCANFDSAKKNDAYIRENILFHHDSLPMGEFAIGTNTTAYAMAHRFNIAPKLPILIAEKTGPHFAVGDTCYSWEEDNRLFNPDGREIIAKENEVSALRKEDPSKAYFECHTDITIPYEELGKIEVLGDDGYHAVIIENGRFVLPGTEELNKPLDEMAHRDDSVS
ncbi:MAG: aminopeptidase [Lachnospiraceae bacterium]|nr:aminopeptidase [Lachnospiraceae bacterium]